MQDYPEHFTPEQFSLDAWKWALSVIWSRSFVVDEEKRGLVPWVLIASLLPLHRFTCALHLSFVAITTITGRRTCSTWHRKPSRSRSLSMQSTVI